MGSGYGSMGDRQGFGGRGGMSMGSGYGSMVTARGLAAAAECRWARGTGRWVTARGLAAAAECRWARGTGRWVTARGSVAVAGMTARGSGGRGGQRVGFGAPAEDKSTAFLTKSKDEFRAVHGSGRQRQEAENSQQGQYGDQYDSYSMGRGGGGRDMYGGGQDRYGGGRGGPYQDR